MAKIQDIDIPYLEFAEAAAPGTPASGIVRIYAKSDGSLYQKDDAGTETGLAGGGGGSVATDTIWDAAGDLAVGTGADTAARLAKGSAGAELGLSNGSVAWTAGTSFPGSPATGDRYYRTDRHLEYFYDGTRWLTTTLYREPLPILDVLGPNTTSGAGVLYLPTWDTLYDMYVERWWMRSLVVGTLNGSNYWTYKLQSVVNDGTATDVGSSVNDSAGSSGTAVLNTTTPNAVIDGSATMLRVLATKTGSPSGTYMTSAIAYRLVG